MFGLSILMGYVVALMYRMQKTVLHVLTGKSEIVRILDRDYDHYHLVKNLIRSLQCSRFRAINNAFTFKSNVQAKTSYSVGNACTIVFKIKNVTMIHNQEKLRSAFISMNSYYTLVEQVCDIQRIRYNSENSDHECDLMALWKSLKPTEELVSRDTKQWQEIGFQGTDPATDFRGMGILSLKCLLYFCKRNNCAQVFQHSLHPKYGYFFAIVGIDMTKLCFNLLTDGQFAAYFYNKSIVPYSITDFYILFSVVFTMFDDFWLEEHPETIMEFSRIRSKFLKRLQNLMTKNETWYTLTSVR